MGVQPRKKFVPDKVAENHPRWRGNIFFRFGTSLAVGLARGPEGLAAAACCLLLDAQAPPQGPNNLINRLKYYVLQLGGPSPNPNQDWVLGPS